MRGVWILVLLLPALAARFAAFTVEPAGDQVVDLATGVTTLPEGGRLVDAERGISLEAAYIEYKEGEFVRAKKARLVQGDLRFQAGRLEYDVESEQVVLEEGVFFSSKRLKGLRAPRGVLYLKDQVAVLTGGVRSESPAFEAEQMVADTQEGLVLLVGSFRYQDPELGITLKGQGPTAQLLLRFLQDGEVEAETEVPAEIYVRLSAYLGG